MRIEPILSARSAEDAHHALDDFGIAKLDTTELEASWSPTAEVSDDLEAPTRPRISNRPTRARDNVSGGGDGDNDDQEADAAPDTTQRRALRPERAPAAKGREPETGGRKGERSQRAGSAGPRTGRQTRLRSYVVETDEDEGDQGTVGDEAPDLSPIDMAGVARVLEYERKCGRDPREMAHSNAGFDVESYDKHGELVRRIEIKSTGGQWSIAGVMLSRRQHQQAVEDGDLFWLYVVENAQDDDFKIYRIQNPASRIDYFGFDGGWKDVAEPDVERDEAGTPTARSTRGLLDNRRDNRRGQTAGYPPCRRAPVPLGLHRHISAEFGQVALAALLAPDGQPREVIVAQRVSGFLDPCPDSGEQRVLDFFADRLALLIEVQHLDEVRALTRQLLIAHRVDVQLVAGDVFVLSSRRGLEVDDRQLVRVEAADEVDPAVDGDPRRDVDLDLLLAVHRPLKVSLMLPRDSAGPPRRRRGAGLP